MDDGRVAQRRVEQVHERRWQFRHSCGRRSSRRLLSPAQTMTQPAMMVGRMAETTCVAPMDAEWLGARRDTSERAPIPPAAEY